ncbi:sulfatase-like hydrolase/transferase [Prosthecobacter sp.]|uniref:sulfatase-like hydrolase/transferase n=1 Tax=Prosthecobacter sp. TaxID=1965333 RepID=UPI003783E682
MKFFLGLLSSFVILHPSFPLQPAFARAAEARPNIVLIMADDLGYECITANGGESYQTPNLDKLAASGLRFENCHVQPLCTPTRVQLMTGRYNVRNYLNFGTLPRTETTFGNLMKGAGYATGICGKWQLGHEADSPQHFGFEESCLWQQTRRPPRYANPGLEYNGVEKDFSHGEYGPTLVNDFALSFIAKNKEKPFFLYYPMMLTHSPYQPTPDSPDWDPTISSENKQQAPKHFADMVAYMDKMVGRVVAWLDELGIRDNTLLIFLGDNGTGAGTPSRFKGMDVKGGKGSTTASGTHVPLIVSWPAAIKQGRVSTDLVSSTDFLPTICAAAGAKAPENVDGVSFLPQLKGDPGTPREWLYSWYSPRQSQDLTVKEYAFDHRFKLYRGGRFYDLSTDSAEKQDLSATTLSADASAAKARLLAALDRYKDARPTELDREFEASGKGREKPEKKARKKKQK